jgi:3-deoxy-D-manno-octulosonic-acid transferase
MSRSRLAWQIRLLLWIEGRSLPFWHWVTRRRLASGKETVQSVSEKLMTRVDESHLHVPGCPVIWGHAVGVGELLALFGLFKRLSQQLPNHHFLLTSHSRTSGEALRKQVLPDRFHHQFAPIDHPQVMQRFLDLWKPTAACWSEMDLWPGMVIWTAERHIPMLMFNLRVDARKANRLKQWNWFYRPILSHFTRLYPQNESSAGAMRSLGYAEQLASVGGNIKALAPALGCEPTEPQHWRSVLADRPVWLLASSHLGEEAIALQAHQALLAQHPQALLLIVPRDAFRGAEIAALVDAQGIQGARRSIHEALQPSHSVYVADTMGELGLWYALSPVALVGGSLVPIGGHNPYEPLAAGCAVLSGPQVHNFSESYDELFASSQARMVRNANELAAAVADTWAQRPAEVSCAGLASPKSVQEPSALLLDILQTLQTPLKP